MPACSSFIRLGRFGSYRSGEVSSLAGLSIASSWSSSYKTGTSQNSCVAGEESLIGSLTISPVVQAPPGPATARSRPRRPCRPCPCLRGFLPCVLQHLQELRILLQLLVKPLVEGVLLPRLADI